MDKNQIIGLVLIFALIFGYMVYTAPSEEEQKARQQRIDSIKNAQAQAAAKLKKEEVQKQKEEDSYTLIPDSLQGNDSLILRQARTRFGSFAEAATGKAQSITLENNKIKVKISTRGGYPYFTQIKGFKTHDGKPLVLFNKDENSFALKFYAENKAINTQELFFDLMTPDTLYKSDNQEQSVVMRMNAGEGKYLEYTYTLAPESYLLDFDVKFVGLAGEMANSSYLDATWKAKSRRQEQGEKWENQNSTIYYKHYEEEVSYLTETADEEDEKVDTRLRWIAYKDHFFTSALIAKEYFSEADMRYRKDESQEKYLKHYTSNIVLPFSQKKEQAYAFCYYFGPNDYSILKHISVKKGDDLRFERLIPLGWGLFRWINQWVIIPLFKLLVGILGSRMGLIILIMTVLIKLALFPFTYRSYTSSAKTRVLKPQVDEITKKIPKEKAMERQQKTMELYKKAGVNPMGGCLPLLFQMPILIAMYRFFPGSIELRQQKFLWATDLSTYDSIASWTTHIPLISNIYGNHISLFTLLMAISMLVSQLMNRSQMQGSGAQMPGMNFMLYMMPVMMMFWFNNYSSGLSYYYLLSNIITIVQTLIIRRMIDEEALLAKLNANKKKVRKKTKWQMRLEQAQKMQEQQRKKKR